jgi:acyl carrier protein
MKELLEILNSIRPDVDFEKETKLIDDSILDSFDIISIVGELNEHYDIEIDVEDLEPDNFNTAKAILALVTKLQED